MIAVTSGKKMERGKTKRLQIVVGPYQHGTSVRKIWWGTGCWKPSNDVGIALRVCPALVVSILNCSVISSMSFIHPQLKLGSKKILCIMSCALPSESRSFWFAALHRREETGKSSSPRPHSPQITTLVESNLTPSGLPLLHRDTQLLLGAGNCSVLETCTSFLGLPSNNRLPELRDVQTECTTGSEEAGDGLS